MYLLLTAGQSRLLTGQVLPCIGTLSPYGYHSLCFAGANAKARQSCLGHLITKAKEINRELLLVEDKTRDKKAEVFCDDIAVFFSNACSVVQELLSGSLQWNQAPLIEKQFLSELQKLCACKLSYNPAETLRALPHRKRSKAFIYFPSSSPS